MQIHGNNQVQPDNILSRTNKKVTTGIEEPVHKFGSTDAVNVCKNLTRPDPNVLNLDDFDKQVSALTNTKITTNNSMELLIEGKKAYGAIDEVLDSAKETINMNMFIFADDKTSWGIAEKLAAKAKSGVKVNLMIDAIGSTSKYSEVIYNYLKCAGVNFMVHNDPLKGGDPLKADFRDHCKIIVADGKTAMTGGMNIANEYKNEWHDIMIRVKGEAVADIQNTFIRNFERSGGKIQGKEKMFPPVDNLNGFLPSRVVYTNEESRGIEQSVFKAVDSAKKNIYVESPYFGDKEFVDKLIAAKKRGVDVKLVLPNVSDLPFADTSARAHFDDMQKAGIDIYLYTDKIIHAKAMSVDGVWATIGSANTSARGFGREREMNVAFSEPNTVKNIDKDLFENDIKNHCKKLEPNYKPGLINKITNWLADKFI